MPRTHPIDTDTPFSMRETEHDWLLDFTASEEGDPDWLDDLEELDALDQ